MTVNIIDTTTPLVGLKAGAEVYNANFTDSNNAASKEVGTLPDNVPTNADLPTFGTAASANTGSGASNVPLNSDLGTASTKNTGTAAGDIPLNSDLGTASTKNVQASPADATAGAVLNNETTHIGGELNYTDANYQPSTLNGLNTQIYAVNKSGSNIADGATVSGSLLKRLYFDGSLQATDSSQALVGTWKSMAGESIPDNFATLFVRIA